MDIKIAPSILAANFADLKSDIKAIEKAGCQYVHIDVMDGHFVPNISFGSVVISAVRKITDMMLDVHLMIDEPLKYIPDFLKAGADIITYHYETNTDFDAVYKMVKDAGKKLAISINPSTDVSVLEPYIGKLDMVLIMSVNPGFGAQSFIESSIEKISALRRMAPDLDIEVDGGIKLGNVDRVIKAGANVIVAGSAIFGADDITATASEFIGRCND